MFRKYSKSRNIGIYIIVVNTLWAYSSSRQGFEMVKDFNCIQNFLSIFLIGLVLGIVVFLFDVKKHRKLETNKDLDKKIKIKVEFNLMYFTAILIAGFVYIRVAFSSINDEIFHSVKNDSILLFAVLIVVGVVTYIYETYKTYKITKEDK